MPFGALRLSDPWPESTEAFQGVVHGRVAQGPERVAGIASRRNLSCCRGPTCGTLPSPALGVVGCLPAPSQLGGEDGRCSLLPGFEFWTLDVGLRL